MKNYFVIQYEIEGKNHKIYAYKVHSKKLLEKYIKQEREKGRNIIWSDQLTQECDLKQQSSSTGCFVIMEL